MTETAVNTLGELVEAVTARTPSGQSYWFRGQSDSDWAVEPSIRRGYTKADEQNLIHRFRARAGVRYTAAPGYQDRARWLSLMQHYGLPTRLLDWTRSPLVATYFALNREARASVDPSRDASLWVLDPRQLNENQGIKGVTPSIESKSCSKELDPAFDPSFRETGHIMAVMSSEYDLRMFVQQGCFTIHSETAASLDNHHHHAAYLHRLLIPAQRVDQMRKQLDACGVKRGDLFPDLAALADDLRATHPPSAK